GRDGAAAPRPDRPPGVPRRAAVVVYHNAPAVELDACLLGFKTLRVRDPSDREQDLVCVHRAPLAAGGEVNLHAAVSLDDLRDLAVGVDLAAELAQVLGVGRD